MFTTVLNISNLCPIPSLYLSNVTMAMRQLKITASITSRESDSLEKYLSDIAKIEMVTPEEEVLLARFLYNPGITNRHR